MTSDELSQLEQALNEELNLAIRDRTMVTTLNHELKSIPLITLPELPLDAHDLGSLIELHQAFIDIETPTS
mgnify:CR=1 FL=1